MKQKLPVVVIIILILILAGLLIYAGYFLIKKRGVPEPPSQSSKLSEEERVARREALLETIQEITKGESAGTEFSVGIYDLKRDEYFGYNDEKAQHAASVSKVLTAVYIYDLAEKGKVNLGEPMGLYNIETQIQFLINQSSPDSWDLLDTRFKPEDQTTFAKKIGLTASNIRLGKNLMSVKDVTLLFKKLAQGELLSESSRTKLFSYMQNTETEVYFSPSFKRADVKFYHKTGQIGGEAHDAAIVEYKPNPFVLVVFSNNNVSPNITGRGKIMELTAQTVLEYFSQIN